MRLRSTLGAAALLLIAAQGARAQSPGQFLPREPDTRFDAAKQVAPPKATPPPAPVAAPGNGQFVLRSVVLDGATALTADELRPIWARLIGQPVTLGSLDAVASGITAAYRARGYVLSQAMVPAQGIAADGTVHIQVIEGFIDSVAIDGGAPSQRRYAERLFAPVATDRPLALSTLERAVLLGRDTFGGTLETVLQPSATTFAAADLTVMMTPDPWRGFAALDNRGSRLYGDVTASAGATAYNLFGLNEQLDILFAGAPQNGSLAYGQARMEAPLVPLSGTMLDGGRLVLEADSSRADPDLAKSGSPQDLDVIDHETNATIGLFVPFTRTRSQNLFGRLSLDWQQSESDTGFAGSGATTTDKLLVLTARLVWDRADLFGGVTQLDASLRQGLSVPGLTEIGATGPAAGNQDFTLGALTLSRLQRVGGGDWSVYGELIGQLASTVLPNSERFALGDATIGRGFAPGNTTGNSGFGGRIELRRDFGAAAFNGMAQATQLYAFGDYGTAYDRSIARDGEAEESLGSVGIGARVDLRPWLTITPEIARQTTGVATDTTETGLETRFYIGVVARF